MGKFQGFPDSHDLFNLLSSELFDKGGKWMLSDSQGILIIENDSSILRFLSLLIGNNTLCRPIPVRDGKQAINAFLYGTDIRAAVMETRLPDLDGLDLVRFIREIERRSGRVPIPIIAYTTQVQGQPQPQGLGDGFAEFLSKPSSSVKILRAIQRNLRYS